MRLPLIVAGTAVAAAACLHYVLSEGLVQLLDVRSINLDNNTLRVSLYSAAVIPLESLGSRLFELGPRGRAPWKAPFLFVLGSSPNESRRATEFLVQKGWTVSGSISDSDFFWLFCRAIGVAATQGREKRGRLWAPNPILTECIDSIERKLDPSERIALDLGCGVGRDVSSQEIALHVVH